jgi:Domain of unknown function (DUF4340)
MKLKSSTLVLMAAALLSTGGIYLWEQSRSPQDLASDPKKATKPLFDLKETDITQLTIASKNPTLKLEKNAKGWQLAAPKAGPANEGTVTFLLNLLATGTSEQTLQVEPAQLKEFGLEQPTATLSFQLKNQKTHQVVLGKQNFNQSAVYAQIDSDSATAKKGEVVLVPTGFLDAINRPLSEWQVKASSPKPIPSATPTPSVSPTPLAIPTPSANPT